MSGFKSKLAVIIAGVYLLPGLWVIASLYSCGSMLCELGAIVYSALPVPFIKGFYIAGAVVQGVSWWEPQWPLPGAPLAALSLICNTVVIYFGVSWAQSFFKRKSTGA
jgi:hypothetical protein